MSDLAAESVLTDRERALMVMAARRAEYELAREMESAIQGAATVSVDWLRTICRRHGRKSAWLQEREGYSLSSRGQFLRVADEDFAELDAAFKAWTADHVAADTA